MIDALNQIDYPSSLPFVLWFVMLIVAGLLYLAVLWLLGRWVVKQTMAVIGFSLGAIIGVILFTITEYATQPWLWILLSGGVVAGLFVLFYRFATASLLCLQLVAIGLWLGLLLSGQTTAFPVHGTLEAGTEFTKDIIKAGSIVEDQQSMYLYTALHEKIHAVYLNWISWWWILPLWVRILCACTMTGGFVLGLTLIKKDKEMAGSLCMTILASLVAFWGWDMYVDNVNIALTEYSAKKSYGLMPMIILSTVFGLCIQWGFLIIRDRIYRKMGIGEQEQNLETVSA